MRIAKKRLKTIDYLATEISNTTNIAASDVKAIIIALFDLIKLQMRDNNYVIIDGFATFWAKQHKGHSGSIKGKPFEVLTKSLPYCDFDDSFRNFISSAFPRYRPGDEPQKSTTSKIMADNLISTEQVENLPMMVVQSKDHISPSVRLADNLLD